MTHSRTCAAKLFIGQPAPSIPWEEGEAARVTLELHGLAVMVGHS